MDVITLARELGKAIQADERYAAYNAAKKVNDDDEKLQQQIGEFNLVRMSLERELSAEERNDERVREYNEKLRTLYGEIMSTESMTKFNEAKTALDELVNSVNTIITMSVNGQDPDTVDPTASCGGDCSACGGCH
ncbi:MAG: YlbF family regulator [Clostridia bacterium]|nr:YlbF family regulator [Clostridia bacterium]MBQ2274340.1 YlbF family regulator [Clostridia bacterium]MBQ5798433.1 YlbF family regulator [Clostridia bacterium]MEE1277784.1 YlbF family regulator [Acutalibacteraceae bacterium]